MKLNQLLFASAAAVSALAAAPAQAVTYDAFSSFDGTQGAGNFYYLKADSTGGSLLAPSSSCVIAGSTCLQADNYLPGAYKSPIEFVHSGTVNVPDDRLLVHPGPNSSILVSFHAPVTGAYDFDVLFNIVDNNPTGVALFAFNTSTGLPVFQPLTFLNSPGASYAYSGSLFLDAGEVLTVGINPAANYSSDSVGLQFTMTTLSGAVPEPATWAMMLAGFGAVGSTMRRRRNVTLACG